MFSNVRAFLARGAKWRDPGVENYADSFDTKEDVFLSDNLTGIDNYTVNNQAPAGPLTYGDAKFINAQGARLVPTAIRFWNNLDRHHCWIHITITSGFGFWLQDNLSLLNSTIQNTHDIPRGDKSQFQLNLALTPGACIRWDIKWYDKNAQPTGDKLEFETSVNSLGYATKALRPLSVFPKNTQLLLATNSFDKLPYSWQRIVSLTTGHVTYAGRYHAFREWPSIHLPHEVVTPFQNYIHYQVEYV